jgi:hypothetical protein
MEGAKLWRHHPEKRTTRRSVLLGRSVSVRHLRLDLSFSRPSGIAASTSPTMAPAAGIVTATPTTNSPALLMSITGHLQRDGSEGKDRRYPQTNEDALVVAAGEPQSDGKHERDELDFGVFGGERDWGDGGWWCGLRRLVWGCAGRRFEDRRGGGVAGRARLAVSTWGEGMSAVLVAGAVSSVRAHVATCGPAGRD